MQNGKTSSFVFSLVFVFIVVSLSYCDDIGGTLSENTVLNLTGSPYTVTDNLIVPENISLTIDPGVIVKFNSSKKLQVYGELYAVGTSSDSIVFITATEYPTTPDWNGLYFNSTAVEGIELGYCDISYASPGVQCSSNNPYYQSESIHNCTIRNFCASGTNYGIYITGGAYPEIRDNDIYQTYLSPNYGYGIYLAEGSTNDFTVIDGNYISNCQEGIRLYYNYKVQVTGNTITNNTTYGIGLYGGCHDDNLINGNNIYGNNNYELYLYSDIGSFNTVNAEDNWWGSSDPAVILSEIYDHNNSSSRAMVDFAPFLNGLNGIPVPAEYYLQGRINEDMDLTDSSNPYYLCGIAEIGSNARLSILPGVTIKVYSGKLEVYGELYAVGTSSDSIVFMTATEYPTTPDWNGLYFNSTAVEGIELGYCDISYASPGVQCSSNNPYYQSESIHNCTIRNFCASGTNYGIYITGGAYPEIRDNDIYQTYLSPNYGYGIYLAEGSTNDFTVIDGNYISNCQEGIRLYYNYKVQVTGNTIMDNSRYGIYLQNGFIAGNVINGNNIYNNNNYEVYIHNSTGSSYTINAENNYWGYSDSTSIAQDVYDYYDSSSRAKCDFVPFSDELFGSLCPADFNFNGRVDGFDLAILGAAFGSEPGDYNWNALCDINNSSRVDGFDLAIFATYFGQVVTDGMEPLQLPPFQIASRNETTTLFLSIDQQELDPGDVFTVVVNVTGIIPILGFAFDLNFDPKKIEVVEVMDNNFLAQNDAEAFFMNSFDNENGRIVIGSAYQSPASVNALEDGIICTLKLKIKNNTDNLQIDFANIGLIGFDGITYYPVTVEGLEISIEQPLPTSYALKQNYPNPFNPTTTIEYQIPAGKGGYTELVIYNILGEKVKTLVSDYQEPGYYKVEWDGSNNSGGFLSSGLYFYRLKSKDYNSLKKMILVK